ncbi:MAG: imidazolonepropionase [Planctomycetota bacterium]|jgi:imidazolonepropionase
MVDLLVRNASQILTCAVDGVSPPLAGRHQAGIGAVTGGVAIQGGRIVEVGPGALEAEADKVVDAEGGVVLPGFVDCHTHAVFVGSRADEFEQRAKGLSYSEIARRGGGIRKSMEMLREASDEELAAAVRRHLDGFLAQGTTTIEAKSGYGLSLEHELRSLRALGVEHRVEVVRTCLAAHSVPPEFATDRKGYVDLVRREILPAVRKEGLAQYCDVFHEKGAFNFAEAERILLTGKKLGLRGRVHADQLSRSGGARLACRVGAITADHLEFCTRDDAVAMRRAGVLAVFLPAANHYLDQEERPPARAMITVGCPIAVATDFNPGSSPTQSMPLVLNMAVVRFGLSVAEAIVGATINAACAAGVEKRVGSLEIGKQADLIICDRVADYRDLAYRVGGNPVRTVIKRGEVVQAN